MCVCLCVCVHMDRIIVAFLWNLSQHDKVMAPYLFLDLESIPQQAEEEC